MNPPPLPPRRGSFVRVLLGVWNTIDFTRKLVLNLLFFVVLLLALGLIARSGGALAPLGEGTTLVLEPQGALVEQYSADPLDRALRQRMGEAVDEVQLRDLLRALDAAKDDQRIERVVLRLDGLRASGYASLRELGQAVAALRDAGKPVPGCTATASITAKRCTTGSAWTCTCSRSANTNPPPSRTCLMLHPMNPKRPICSG